MKHIYVLILIGILTSCSEDNETQPLEIGNDFIESTTKVFYIDTLTIKSSTFQFDSLVVSNPNRLLIGSYLDPIFGHTESKSFIQLNNNFDYSIEDNAQYDSIALILKHDNYFYNDTIPSQKLTVHQVLENIEPNEGNYYNTSNFNFENTFIGVKNFNPKPYKNDFISIKINNTYGNSLFTKILQKDITNNDEFLNEYKGLLVQGENTNTTVLGFSTNSILRIYYTIEGEEYSEKTLDFTINTANTFNKTSSNKNGTYFSSIVNQKTQIPSTETDNNSFIQAGTGVATRIDIPAIETLYDIPGTGTLINANLKISLKQSSATNNLHVRDSLKVYIINHKAEIVGTLTSTEDGNELLAIKNIEDQEFDTSYYNISMKQFLDIKLNTPNEDFFLALYSKEFNSSVDRYVLNGEENSDKQKIQLEVIYAIYDDE